jgi:hypothetical protein
LEERAAAVASIIVRPPTLPIVTDCVLRLLIVALHQQPLQQLVLRDAASVAGTRRSDDPGKSGAFEGCSR